MTNEINSGKYRGGKRKIRGNFDVAFKGKPTAEPPFRAVLILRRFIFIIFCFFSLSLLLFCYSPVPSFSSPSSLGVYLLVELSSFALASDLKEYKSARPQAHVKTSSWQY